MSATKQESLIHMLALVNRLSNLVVEMQVRKAQMLARSDTSHKSETNK